MNARPVALRHLHPWVEEVLVKIHETTVVLMVAAHSRMLTVAGELRNITLLLQTLTPAGAGSVSQT